MAGQAEQPNAALPIQAEQELPRINDEWVAARVRGDTATLNCLLGTVGYTANAKEESWNESLLRRLIPR
jgi:hypothetical protein